MLDTAHWLFALRCSVRHGPARQYNAGGRCKRINISKYFHKFSAEVRNPAHKPNLRGLNPRCSKKFHEY